MVWWCGLLAPATHNLASALSVPDNGINTNPPLLLLMTEGILRFSKKQILDKQETLRTVPDCGKNTNRLLLLLIECNATFKMASGWLRLFGGWHLVATFEGCECHLLISWTFILFLGYFPSAQSGDFSSCCSVGEKDLEKYFWKGKYADNHQKGQLENCTVWYVLILASKWTFKSNSTLLY